MHLIALSFLPVCLPLALIVGGYHLGRDKTTNLPQKATRLSLGLVAFFLIMLPVSYFLVDASQYTAWIRHAWLNQIMLGLVAIMGWVLITFSQNYMAGQANLHRYYRWLMFTLASVGITVITNHLVVFWLGWLCISLSLNNLLTFYPDRPRAILAAHKKFILARIAELALFASFVLLYQQHQTLYISTILNALTEQSNAGLALHWQDQTAACLIAFAALIKCAQLPFHGWLIQVVESPTPVSALLHAGVINLGGYMLLLFAPLVAQSSVAIWMLLVIAGLSTLISALVMTTRISVKVRLAWSTSAQMGLMLIEFALGLYELVLLHLLAHSFYKAYSFLNSGNAVNDTLRLSLSKAISKKEAPSRKIWFFAIVFSVASVTLVRTVFGFEGAFSSWWLFALALTLLVIQWTTCEHPSPPIYTLTVGVFLCALYATLKIIMEYALPAPMTQSITAFSLADIWAMVLFTLLFVLSTLLHYQPHWAVMRRLSIVLFAGLYIDEWFTRAVLKIWPVVLPTRAKDQNKIPSTINLPENF